jgi:hypothetical protein
MRKDTLILTFSQEEKEFPARKMKDIYLMGSTRLPLPLGEGWGEGQRLARRFH